MQTPESDQLQGAMIGFMIGDVLAVPTAYLTEREIKKTIGYVREFITNYHNPFSYLLKKGEYGSNSALLINTFSALITKQGYHHLFLTNKLKQLVKKAKDDFFSSPRCFGSTTTATLLSGQPSKKDSASCIYRSVAIALFYRDLEKILYFSRKHARITHLSPVSLAASDFICTALFYLKKREKNLHQIFKKSLQLVKDQYNHHDIEILLKKLNLILDRKINSIKQAKNILGTGSLAHMIVPMALYCVLRYPHNFEKAVVLAANCYRDDSPEEKKRLRHFIYIKELLECNGGCTDGIAAITGALSGCLHGYSALPLKFLHPLEDKERVLQLTADYSADGLGF